MSAVSIVLAIIIIDQLAKFVVLKNFHPGESLPIIKNVFHITLVFNKGVAFSIFSQVANTTFIWISLICIIVIILIFTAHKKFFPKARSAEVYLSLILAGAAGNLVDRVRLGYVTDFLDFRIWPVFNIADSAITIGVFLLVLQILKHKNVSDTV